MTKAPDIKIELIPGNEVLTFTSAAAAVDFLDQERQQWDGKVYTLVQKFDTLVRQMRLHQNLNATSAEDLARIEGIIKDESRRVSWCFRNPWKANS